MSDSIARRVAQKEIRLFFSSPVAWLFLAAFLGITGFVFFWVESFFARNIADVRPLFEWMPVLLIFLCAALTMRMWSDERRNGTLEHILTQPAPLWLFVVGKFRACLALLLLALAGTAPLPVTVALIADLDWGPVLSAYIATTLLGASYLAIGLYVSARTDNPIVSLIGTVALCALVYLLGSPVLTAFFDDRTAEILRLLGSGARFASITRGVIDFRDLFYYISLIGIFLTLNVYTLEKQRWAKSTRTVRHRYWRAATTLLLINLLLANIWMAPLTTARVDVTRGKLFSISATTRDFLEQLQEPLLIRAYFSDRTHPLLAPLVPQLRDLMHEYALAGKGKVRVEFIDPAQHPELEKEANKRYGINATPFQINDRHQSALVNAYFNVLVQYGNEHQALGFADLIEVRTAANRKAEVILRNPEYDITHAIKKVLFDYRMGGSLFDSIDAPVELIAYVSADELLPQQLRDYKQAILPQLELAARGSVGKFSFRFIAPESGSGAVARHIGQEWGFKPMVTSPGDEQKFYFYLTLADSRQVVQLPTDNFDPAEFRLMLDTGLKRFASGFTKTVALSLPETNAQMARYHLGGPTFSRLEQVVSRDHSIVLEDLSDGQVSPEADILAVVAPLQLQEQDLFAIDQFLMRGGTVVLATSPFTAEISDGQLHLQDWDSGLGPWLASHGIEIEPTLVLDKQNAAFPTPVTRRSGDQEFRDVQMIDYPYFIDLRPPGLSSDHPVTTHLPQLTMAWASPVEVLPNANRRITVMLESSPRSWLSDSMDIMPSLDAQGRSQFIPPTMPDTPAALRSPLVKHQLGLVMQGRFDSWFADAEDLPATAAGEGASSYNNPGRAAALPHSAESARLVLFASNDFMDDQILSGVVAASGTGYLGPLELFMNTLDWALQDDQLLQIRSRAHFNRTLPPMERSARMILEYLNYGAALLWLLLLALVGWSARLLRRRRYARGLGL